MALIELDRHHATVTKRLYPDDRIFISRSVRDIILPSLKAGTWYMRTRRPGQLQWRWQGVVFYLLFCSLRLRCRVSLGGAGGETEMEAEGYLFRAVVKTSPLLHLHVFRLSRRREMPGCIILTLASEAE